MPDDNDLGSLNDYLWKALARYDVLIGGVNSKVALITAFNVFFLSGSLFKWNEIHTQMNFGEFSLSLSIFIALGCVGSLLSMLFSFLAVSPYRRSPKAPGNYHSMLFFDHVSEFKEPKDYLNIVRTQNADDRVRDLAYQIHVLSFGLKRKFDFIRFSVVSILLGPLLSILLSIIIKIYIVSFV